MASVALPLRVQDTPRVHGHVRRQAVAGARARQGRPRSDGAALPLLEAGRPRDHPPRRRVRGGGRRHRRAAYERERRRTAGRGGLRRKRGRQQLVGAGRVPHRFGQAVARRRSPPRSRHPQRLLPEPHLMPPVRRDRPLLCRTARLSSLRPQPFRGLVRHPHRRRLSGPLRRALRRTLGRRPSPVRVPRRVARRNDVARDGPRPGRSGRRHRRRIDAPRAHRRRRSQCRRGGRAPLYGNRGWAAVGERHPRHDACGRRRSVRGGDAALGRSGEQHALRRRPRQHQLSDARDAAHPVARQRVGARARLDGRARVARIRPVRGGAAHAQPGTRLHRHGEQSRHRVVVPPLHQHGLRPRLPRPPHRGATRRPQRGDSRGHGDGARGHDIHPGPAPRAPAGRGRRLGRRRHHPGRTPAEGGTAAWTATESSRPSTPPCCRRSNGA